MGGVIELTNASEVHLTPSAQIYIDESAHQSVAQVAALQSSFRPVVSKDMVRRYDSRVYWLRASLHNATDSSIERWLDIGHARMESVVLYQQRDGVWQGLASGVQVPTAQKPIGGGIVFPLELQAHEEKDILIRVQSRTNLDLNASIWKPLDFEKNEGQRRIFIAIGFGGALTVAFIGIAIFIRSREINFLLFSLLHFSTGLLELGREGLWEEFLWSSVMPFPIELHVVATVVGIVALISIQVRLLELRAVYPRLNAIFLGLAVLSVLLLLVVFVNYEIWVQVAAVIFLSLCLLSLSVCAFLWKKGNEVAGYMFFGYLLFWSLEGLRGASGLLKLNLIFTQNISISWALLISTPLFFFALIEKSRKLDFEMQQIQELYKAKSLFLAKVSHELHSPLNTIIGYARMLRRGSERLSLQEGTHDIEQSGLRLLRMLDDLLDQSRIENSHFELHPQAILLLTWLDEIKRLGMVMSESSGNSFSASVNGPMPAGVLLDSPRLLQVFDNLFSNANRHTRGGNVALKVEAKASQLADKVNLTFSVSDNGQGIALMDQGRIFETFFQGEHGANSAKSKRKGLGLGLPIANHILSLMGSALSLKSAPGTGSTFTFTIACDVVDAPVHQPAVPLSAVTKSGRHRFRLLIVDDEPETLALLRGAAEFLNCNVDSYACGHDAISALSGDATRWNAVITDQWMDQGGGWQVLQYARRHCPSMPVVLLSGMAPQRPDDMPDTLEFDAYLPKPVGMKDLADLLEKLNPEAFKMARPSAQSMAKLQSLVKLGEVSAIEEWCVSIEMKSPEFKDFSQEVKSAVKRLDFRRLEVLALG